MTTKVMVSLEDIHGKEIRVTNAPFEKVADVGIIKLDEKFYVYVPKNSIGYTATFREAIAATWNSIKEK